MRILLFFIGAVLSADGLYCGWSGSMGLGEAIIVIFGILFLIWSSFYESFREKRFLRFVKILTVTTAAILAVYSCAVCIVGQMDNATGREDYVIIPGAALTKTNEPSAVLRDRLDEALTYLDSNTSADVIVSGGQDSPNNISEAHAMANYLIARGISDERILLEESATSTYENFMYSADAVSDGSTVLITNNFHVLRSALMAQRCGIEATHIGAKTPIVQLPPCCAREFIAQIASVRHYLP